MIRDIYIHGRLGQKYGRHFRLDVATAPEAFHALAVQLPGFRESVSRGTFRVIRGDKATGYALGADELKMGLGDKPLHIIPVPEGARGGEVKTIIGAIIFVASFFVPGMQGWGQRVGLLLMASGVATMLTKAPNIQDYGQREVDQKPSFLFNGPINVIEQGGPVPLVYGRFRAGSVVVSAGLNAERI